MAESQTPKSPNWLVPGYPPLEGEVGQAAVAGQLINFPAVVRTMQDDPIANQTMANVSFNLFKEPRKTRSGHYVYGFFKVRGCWASQEQSERMASQIVKQQDSKYQILLAPVGAWLPITDASQVVDEQIDVRNNEEEVHLRDEAAREKDQERRRIQREIREREDQLKKGDIYDDPTSLTYYSMRRVTEVKLREAVENQKRQLVTISEKIIEVQKELKGLEIDHPEYTDGWIDRYNEERRLAGIPDYVPSDDQLEQYARDLQEIELSSDEEDEEDETNGKEEDTEAN